MARPPRWRARGTQVGGRNHGLWHGVQSRRPPDVGDVGCTEIKRGEVDEQHAHAACEKDRSSSDTRAQRAREVEFGDHGSESE